MWTLECDGPLFNYKKLWLRPGSSHLFGRVKQETLRNTESYVLEAKSVSKKHLKLSVAAVKPGAGSQLHARTEVIVEDFSKLGTTIDDVKISQDTRVLKGDEHIIRVAKYEFPLRLKWHPIVFTIANLTKAEKQNADPLLAIREKLEPLDIKFVHEYVNGQTTHVAATKRNVPVVLQGLIHGNHIVTREYVEAITKAATEEHSPQGEPKAPLEKDFEAAWPDAMKFVPATANEPVKRDASYLAPKPERTDVFYGYTFVFCMKNQFEQLKPVINAGSGKAVLYEGFQEGRSDPHDFAAFVKNVAGEKGTGELENSSQGKGVVVVRITTKNPEWDVRFVQESDRQLDQRSIEQNEFLDAILAVNTSGLRQRLAEEIDLTSSAKQISQAPLQETTSTSKAPADATNVLPAKNEPPSSQARRSVRRPVTQSRFKGFDDFDDEEPEQEQGRATVSLSRIAEDAPMDDVRQQPSSAPSRSTRLRPEPNTRKRPTPEPENTDMMDEMLPAAAAMKRRRLNQGESGSAVHASASGKPARKQKQEREIDVLEEAKKMRELEEERAREDAEKLKEAMDGMEIEGPANIVEVEEMQVRSPSVSASRTSHTSSARWDERWNGRPNFKRFRRKGEDRPVRGHKVIVPLEETKKKDFGIGEEYWLESSFKQKKVNQKETQPSQTLQVQEDDEEEEDTQFRRRPRTRPEPDDDEVQIVEESAPMASATTQPSELQTRTQETQTQTQTSRKRSAPEAIKEPPPPKKIKPAWTRDESDEDDDELAFPRARRSTRKR